MRCAVAGSVHIDIFVDVLEDEGADRRGKFEIGIGGTAYNLACNYRFLGMEVDFISALEKDSLFTRLILFKLDEHMGRQWVIPMEGIGESGFIGIRKDGDLLQAINSTPIEKAEIKAEDFSVAIRGSSFAHVDLNNSISMVREFLSTGIPTYISAVSQTKALKLLELKGMDSRGVFLNRQEAGFILKKVGLRDLESLSSIMDCLWVVTMDKEGVAIIERGAIALEAEAPQLERVVSFSGTGDAFAAGFIHGREVLGLDLNGCAAAGYELVRVVASLPTSNALVGNNLENADRLIFVDPLTGLYTRRFFDDEKRTMERRAGKESCSVVLLDIDDFKKINDAYGHDAGDMVLRKVGAIIRKNTRKGDVSVRYGGEEILLVLLGADLTEALSIAERIRNDLIEENMKYGKVRLMVTISGGISMVNKGIEQAIKHADELLYMAKREGKNRICS